MRARLSMRALNAEASAQLKPAVFLSLGERTGKIEIAYCKPSRGMAILKFREEKAPVSLWFLVRWKE